MEKYEYNNLLGEGSFGKVHKATCKATGKVVAIKEAKFRQGSVEEAFPSVILREISGLRMMKGCDNIVNLIDYFSHINENGKSVMCLVFEFLEFDLHKYIQRFIGKTELIHIQTVKYIMYRLLRGVQYCHSRGLIHRDLKPANILMDEKYEVIKVADFGLSRLFCIPTKKITPGVGTVYYQAPEVLLKDRDYSIGADMWSVGCIFAELATTKVLFRTQQRDRQIYHIFRKLGTPNEEDLPGVQNLRLWSKCQNLQMTLSPGDLNLDDSGFDLLLRMLIYKPSNRISAVEAINHPFFDDFRD